MHTLKCKKCNHIFEENIKNRSTKLIIKSGKLVDNAGKPYRTIKGICPKCGGEAYKVIINIPIVWDDNLKARSGYSTVTKRHDEGIYWDQDSRKLKEAQDIQVEMRKESKKVADKSKRKDDEKLKKEYRPVQAKSMKEALDIAKKGSYE